jgi:subtilisin family serine protease/chitodextrinase
MNKYQPTTIVITKFLIMRKLSNLFRAILAALFFVIVSFNANAQDWTAEKSSLYYLGSNGKVYMEPDYTAMAVYFKSTVSQKTGEMIEAKMNPTKGSSNYEISTMDLKGMIRIKSSSTIASLSSMDKRHQFIENFNLETKGAYDVLPAFKIGDKQAWLTKRVTIRLKEGYNYESLADIFENYGANYIKNITNNDTYLFEVAKIENQLPLIQELNDLGVLVWGGPDFKMDIVKYADPLYQYQWHLNNTGGTDYQGNALVNDIDIDAPEAWAVTTGSSSITIAVIDDGVDYSHEDMPTPSNGYTPANNGNGSPSATDDGHGQLVAGLILAQHDNNKGGKGVAPGVDYFSVNIFAPNTTNADVASGINWAVNQGADILTNSWGFGSCTYSDASIADAFTNAANNGRNGKGCPIFIASGNDFQSCVSFPANLSNVIAVGGMAGDADRSNFSNYGSALDICGPSDDNWVNGSPSGNYGCPSTDRMGSAGWTNDNYYMYMGGTSGATPIVSGVASLVLSVNPNLTKAEVENILLTTANDNFAAYNSNEFGAGMVNAFDAVNAAGGVVDNDPPTVPTGLSASNVGSTSFNISWNASSDNIGVAGYNIYLNGSNIGNVAGTSSSVTGLTPSTSYTVRVSAFDGAGNESNQSSAINVNTTQATLNCSNTISSFPYAESFESNDGWTQVTGDDGNWVRDAGGTPSSGTGPSSAVDGSYYMYLEASTNGSTGQIGANATAILESDCFDLTGATEATFSFQYHMYGTAVGSLAIQVSVNDLDWTNLWSLSGDQGNAWNAVDVNLNGYAGGTIKLRIVGTTGSSWSSDIAVDDLNFTTGGGADTQAPTVPTGLSTSNVTQTSATFSWNASSDNVGVTGYDVYVNSSYQGSTAGTSYNVTGLTASTNYTLGVRAKDAAGNTSSQATTNVTTLDEVDTQAPTTPTGLATNGTTQTSTNFSWNASSDNIGVTGYDVYINSSYEGTTTSTSYSITGLSASTTYTLGVRAKDAEGNTSSQATTNVTTLDPVGGGCTGGITSYPYSQGFEGSIGDWTQATNDDLNWTVDANGTPSSSTGPSSADEGSYYMYVESSSPNYPSKVATFISPCFDLSSQSAATFNFAYHMYGANMGSLVLQASTDGSSWTTLWSKSGDQGNSWYNEAISLNAYVGTSVELRFVATTGNSYRSDMAIDDISVTTGGGGSSTTDLTLTITFDNYPEETSWTLVNSGGSTVASGGTYGSQADGSTLVIPINGLADDCYDFTILDSYGDGICCSYGNGSYTLEVTGGATLASGGSFGSSELTNFCLPSAATNFVSTTPKTTRVKVESSFNVYPNPAHNTLNIDAINYEKNAIITVLDVSGAVRISTTLGEVNMDGLDITALDAGIYFITLLENESKVRSIKFIKE